MHTLARSEDAIQRENPDFSRDAIFKMAISFQSSSIYAHCD